ncbi:MAG: UvrD-helicase domain-containing protein [Saccharofermentanales bacterium]
MELTAQQRRIIEIPAGDILVSAAAGSGKTSVMTQRIVNRIRSHELDIRKVLVMTFTDAAARSMKEKIEKQLRDFINEETNPEERRYLSGQMQYLGRSNISTIHSFCLEIVRNFYYEAKSEDGGFIVEPGFRIEDAGEADILLSRAVDELFEEKYEACDRSPDEPGSARFLKLIETYGTQRSDSAVREMIKVFFHFARSIPDYGSYMTAQTELLRAAAMDFESSQCRREIFKALEIRIENAMAGLDEFCAVLDSGPAIYKDKAKNEEAVLALRGFAEFIAGLRRMASAPDTGWDRVYYAFKGMPDVSSLKGKASDDKKKLRRIFDRHFAELVFFGTGNYGSTTYSKDFLFNTDYVFTSDIAGIQQDILYMVPMAEELFSLTQETDRRYAMLKRDANMIDFSDFEHMSLLILRSGNAGAYYRNRFQEIYIDEYQDTSSIQEAVISLISDGNLFMVGDVKQSIYRFRHAKPEIFLSKYKAFSENRTDAGISADGDGSHRTGIQGDADAQKPAARPTGRLVELNKNFRSLEGILAAANNVFYQIMSGESGEVDYTADHALVPFRCSDADKGPQVELVLTDLDGRMAASDTEPAGDDEGVMTGEQGEDFGSEPENGEERVPDAEELLSGEEKTSYEQEAVTVASEIAGLLNSGVRPGEIAVLSRTRNVCGIFADALEQHGMEVLRETGNAGPDYYEMRVAEEFLAVLDNPCQDIPLAGLMRSPFFGTGFSEDELLEIRISAGRDTAYFHECCSRYRESGEDSALRLKVDGFFHKIEHYRSLTDFMTVGEVLGKMYKESDLFAYAAAMPEGQRRLNYLNSFKDWAHDFASARHCGVYEIVRYLESLKEKIGAQSPFPIEEIQSDRIRVMTIHRSKGLEYSIVFIVGTSRKLAPGRRSGAVLLSESSLPGLWYINPDKQYKYPTPLFHAASESMVKGELAEEMRLLYVAMTRAKDRLYISGTIHGSKNRDGKELAEVAAKARKHPAGSPLPSYLALSAKSTLEWIVMALARNPHVDLGFMGDTAAETRSGGITNEEFYSAFWNIRIAYPEDPVQVHDAARPAAEADGTGAGPELPGGVSSEEYAAELRSKFFGIYPYRDATRNPMKFSAGEIKRREQAEEEERLADIGDGYGLPATHAEIRGINTVLKETGSAGEKEITGTERGIAVHSFLRYADAAKLTGNCTAYMVKAHLDEMLQAEMVSEREYAMLEQYIDKFVLYYNSSLAAGIQAAGAKRPERLYREIPFTLQIGCREFYGSQGFAENDNVFVQGIIDCWFMEDDGAVLVDYKTDAITGDRGIVAAELDKRYNTQLSVYSRAIEEIMGVQVKKAVIWLVGAADEYEIRCTRYSQNTEIK